MHPERRARQAGAGLIELEEADVILEPYRNLAAPLPNTLSNRISMRPDVEALTAIKPAVA